MSMSNYPKWLLGLAFINLIPSLLSVFFLFGGVRPFGSSSSMPVDMMLFAMTQLLWLLPIAAFFFGLDRWMRGYNRMSILVLLTGIGLTITDVLLLFG